MQVPSHRLLANDCRAAGRREGLRSFPRQPPLGSACPAYGPILLGKGAGPLSAADSVP